jgi:hypothetical protein
VLFQESGFHPVLKWSEFARSAEFHDQTRTRCILRDLPSGRQPSFEIGVVEGRSISMKLELRHLEVFLEHLRAFVTHGVRVVGFGFEDKNGSHCIIAKSTDSRDCLQLGTVSIPIKTCNGPRYMRVPESLMILDRPLVAEILPYLNSFVAHGSVRPGHPRK